MKPFIDFQDKAFEVSETSQNPPKATKTAEDPRKLITVPDALTPCEGLQTESIARDFIQMKAEVLKSVGIGQKSSKISLFDQFQSLYF